jgi:aromatic ring-opening dioxygenase LigB subunit
MSRNAIEDAGECGMRSVLAMIGMVSRFEGKIEVLSYEGPYGVGYCNALWVP